MPSDNKLLDKGVTVSVKLTDCLCLAQVKSQITRGMDQ